MAPNANDTATAAGAKPDVLSDEFGFRPEDVVVTGFSGRLPECDSIEEFTRKLYAGEDMVNGNPTRWPEGKWTDETVNATCNRTRPLFRLVRRHHADR